MHYDEIFEVPVHVLSLGASQYLENLSSTTSELETTCHL